MTEEYKAAKPIYMQIADKIIVSIVRRELTPGEKLPSVREMAVKSGVNPNTIQRTYSELERMEVVETKRGQGTFVTEQEELFQELKNKVQREIMDSFLDSMRQLGISEEKILDDLSSYIKDEGGKSS
ncbi:GntR family transcriptional regulator [Rossellomorea vietnamensis]|uniref:GntR family transcriptional regulator n=1 Tax=Rossellomorea vietnamensis TaxID=218284 RepID=A0A5D4NZ40_9BACI|nr:GntR family transcriptional regulator [Rossellomorea vietnamensis]TYS19575.1 GntR family transcriptional regulator [Rossellomorea vietnamensis]